MEIEFHPDWTAEYGSTTRVQLFCMHPDKPSQLQPILSKGEWMNQAGLVVNMFYCPRCKQVYAWDGIT